MSDKEKKSCPNCFNNNEGRLELLEKLSGFHNGQYVQDALICTQCGYLEKSNGKKMPRLWVKNG